MWSLCSIKELYAWVEFNPINTIVLFLCLYSLIVNYSFGHPTYWRKSHSSPKLASLALLPTNDVIKRSPSSKEISMGFDLRNCNPDVLLQIWSYFGPYDLTVTSQISKYYKELSCNKILWRNLQSQLPTPKRAPLLSLDPRVRYFETLMYVIEQLLQDPDKLVLFVQGNVYDLTQFAPEHPGGDAVLTQYKGKDATVMFERASHSTFALHVRENMLLFSPELYKGAKGWPQFCIKTQQK